jgi:hypothetical protein
MKRPSALIPVIAGFSVMLILMAAITAIGVTYVRILSGPLTALFHLSAFQDGCGI